MNMSKIRSKFFTDLQFVSSRILLSVFFILGLSILNLSVAYADALRPVLKKVREIRIGIPTSFTLDEINGVALSSGDTKAGQVTASTNRRVEFYKQMLREMANEMQRKVAESGKNKESYNPKVEVVVKIALGSEYQILDWMEREELDGAIVTPFLDYLLSVERKTSDPVGIRKSYHKLHQFDQMKYGGIKRFQPRIRGIDCKEKKPLDAPAFQYESFLKEVYDRARFSENNKNDKKISTRVYFSSHFSTAGAFIPGVYAKQWLEEKIDRDNDEFKGKFWKEYFEYVGFRINPRHSIADRNNLCNLDPGVDEKASKKESADERYVLEFGSDDLIFDEINYSSSNKSEWEAYSLKGNDLQVPDYSFSTLLLDCDVAKELMDEKACSQGNPEKHSAHDNPGLLETVEQCKTKLKAKKGNPENFRKFAGCAFLDKGLNAYIRKTYINKQTENLDFPFTITEITKLLHVDQHRSHCIRLALVLPGGGVKAAYQTRIIDYLYSKDILQNPGVRAQKNNFHDNESSFCPSVNQLNTTGPPQEGSLIADYIVGNSGGALLGMFVASLDQDTYKNVNAKSKMKTNEDFLTSVLWEHKDFHFTKIFAPVDLMRWGSLMICLWVFCLVLFLCSFLYISKKYWDRDTARDARARWGYSFGWILLLGFTPLVLKYFNGGSGAEHVPVIQGVYYFLFLLIAVIGDNCCVQKESVNIKKSPINHKLKDIKWVVMIVLGLVALNEIIKLNSGESAEEVYSLIRYAFLPLWGLVLFHYGHSQRLYEESLAEKGVSKAEEAFSGVSFYFNLWKPIGKRHFLEVLGVVIFFAPLFFYNITFFDLLFHQDRPIALLASVALFSIYFKYLLWIVYGKNRMKPDDKGLFKAIVFLTLFLIAVYVLISIFFIYLRVLGLFSESGVAPWVLIGLLVVLTLIAYGLGKLKPAGAKTFSTGIWFLLGAAVVLMLLAYIIFEIFEVEKSFSMFELTFSFWKWLLIVSLLASIVLCVLCFDQAEQRLDETIGEFVGVKESGITEKTRWDRIKLLVRCIFKGSSNAEEISWYRIKLLCFLVIKVIFCPVFIFREKISQYRFAEAVTNFIQENIRYLYSHHPAGNIRLPRYFRMTLVFSLGWLWWNIIVGPGIYGNENAFKYFNDKVDQFTSKMNGSSQKTTLPLNNKKASPRSDLKESPKRRGQLTLKTLFAVPANSLSTGEQRYFLFSTEEKKMNLRTKSIFNSRHVQDIRKGKRWRFLGEEMLRSAVFSSGSPFPVFAPHAVEYLKDGKAHPDYSDEWLVDGGFAHNTPVEAAKILGAKQVLVVHSSPLPQPKESKCWFWEIDITPKKMLKGDKLESAAKEKRVFSPHDCFLGQLTSNLPRVGNFLFEASQEVDTLSQHGMMVASLSPLSPEPPDPDWPILTDFRSDVIERLKKEASEDLRENTRIGRIHSWGNPVFHQLGPKS